MSAPDLSTRPLRLRSAEGEDRRETDTELVLALQRGDAKAAQALWDRYSPRVHRFLLRSLGRPGPEVEDLTQEVFLRIFTRARLIKKPAALREFGMAVAIRVRKWELRRRHVRRWVRLSDSGEMPDVLIDGVDQEARHALNRCDAILNTLHVRERMAFALRYLEEMTMEEVASSLSTSLSTAKRLVNRSTAQVAAAIGKDTDLLGYFTEGETFRGT